MVLASQSLERLSVAGALRPCRCTDGDPTPQNPAERGGRVNVHAPWRQGRMPSLRKGRTAAPIGTGQTGARKGGIPAAFVTGVGDSRREDNSHEPGDHTGVFVRQACRETAPALSMAISSCLPPTMAQPSHRRASCVTGLRPIDLDRKPTSVAPTPTATADCA